MKQFFKTLYGKISIIFLLLIIIFGAIQIYISLQSSINYVCESSQKINYNLASDLVDRCRADMADSINNSVMKQKMSDLMVMNPRVDIYILDRKGNILMQSAPEEEIQRNRVRLQPIASFLEEEAYHRLPIFGDDPRSPKRARIFSAAKMPYGDTYGYIYVVLSSARSQLASEGIRGSYILSTTMRIFIITLLAAAVTGMIIFFFLTRRLRTFTSTVRQFEEGRFDTRVPIRSNDEIGELGSAFNHMADTIQKTLDELKKNDYLRRELIANISHDLRSPLASVQGYIETVLMKEDKLDEESRRTFLKTILNNVTNLNKLVQQLFELSKLDAMQMKPAAEPFSITELAQDVVLKFQPHAEKKHIHLMTKLPVSLPLVFADIAMIERVLSNLIDNALHYTPEGGRITISIQRNKESIDISIRDTGSGIPEEDLPFIFNRFYRVEKSRKRDSGGSGLGLAIAKKIVEAHDSIIHASSKVGEGTEFRFKLPLYNVKKVSPSKQISMEEK